MPKRVSTVLRTFWCNIGRTTYATRELYSNDLVTNERTRIESEEKLHNCDALQLVGRRMSHHAVVPGFNTRSVMHRFTNSTNPHGKFAEPLWVVVIGGRRSHWLGASWWALPLPSFSPFLPLSSFSSSTLPTISVCSVTIQWSQSWGSKVHGAPNLLIGGVHVPPAPPPVVVVFVIIGKIIKTTVAWFHAEQILSSKTSWKLYTTIIPWTTVNCL